MVARQAYRRGAEFHREQRRDQTLFWRIEPRGCFAGRMKLCLRDKDKNELYNLREDPDERHNLYYRSEQVEIIARLTDEIHRWQRRVGDTLKL